VRASIEVGLWFMKDDGGVRGVCTGEVIIFAYVFLLQCNSTLVRKQEAQVSPHTVLVQEGCKIFEDLR
jgi:hypothetical protein